ncbi:hypothetical protein RB598_003443 [Gaeumannomyces tritici]
MLGCLPVRQADRLSEAYATMPNQDWRMSWGNEEPTLQERQQQRLLSLLENNIDPTLALDHFHAMAHVQGDHIRSYRSQHQHQPQQHRQHQYAQAAHQQHHFQQLQQWGFPSQEPLPTHNASSAAQARQQHHLAVAPEAAADHAVRMSTTPTLVLSDSLDTATTTATTTTTTTTTVFDDAWVDPVFGFEDGQGERRSSELFPPRLQHTDSFSAPCSPALRPGYATSAASYSSAASPAPSHAGMWDPELLDPDLASVAANLFATAAAPGAAGGIYSGSNRHAAAAAAAASSATTRAATPAEQETGASRAMSPSLPTTTTTEATSTTAASPSPSTAALRGRSASAGRTRAGPDWMPDDVREMGCQPTGPGGSWRCTHPGCGSTRAFLRACDLRKHYRAHTKSHFCSIDGCPRFYNGFSSEKDCRRHMRSHNPNIECPAEGCGRKFSRVDNMRKHHEAIHQRRHPHRRRLSGGPRDKDAGSPETGGEDGAPVLEGVQTSILDQ